MTREHNTNSLIKNAAPKLNKGRFVFVTTTEPEKIPSSELLCQFREKEGTTYILEKNIADKYGFSYFFIASWITLTVHSSLEAVGLTARVATALAKEGISCNAIAAYCHDHIFVPYKDTDRAMNILRKIK
ncbi:MAG: ACT domain-containing protein [Bacteroidales bacterium]|nr:ACT domain-containing protein [Bacteroidales bacterium]